MKLFTIILLFIPMTWAQLDIEQKGVPSKGLKIKQSKVPSFDFKPGKDIPRISLGQEAQLSYKGPVVFQPLEQKTPLIIKKSPAQKMIDIDKKSLSFSPSQVAKSLVTKKSLPDTFISPLKDTYSAHVMEPNVALKDIILFKPQEFKILEGQIYYEKIKNFEMALSLFSEILKDKEFGLVSLYFYGITAKELKLYSEFKNALIKVAAQAKQKELKFLALEALVQNVAVLEIYDIGDIDPLVEAAEYDASSFDSYQFYKAKYYLEKGNLTEVEDALSKINEKSDYFLESKFISGLSKYRQAKIDEAEFLIKDVTSHPNTPKSLVTLASLTLARIYFQKQNYKEAQKLYLAVDKDHPLWLQGMVELAWTQILLNDYEGAAGNMFSLHTDFFKNAYNPESYVVRTVSYLNLCQFGDSLQVLNSLGRKYAPYFGHIEKYLSEKKSPLDFYQTVRAWLKNPEQKVVDGLPRSFILELARHPSFIAVQKDINRLEDEITSFNQITLNLIQREKDLIKKQNDLSTELTKDKTLVLDPKNNKQILTEQIALIEAKLRSFKYQQQGIKSARDNIKSIRDISFVRIDKDKQRNRDRAGQILHERINLVSGDLKELLDQNELLQYEVYSGAGEHIRFQTVSQDVKGDDPKARELALANLQKEKDKKVKWNFKGEIWEDEIGHFRSSLKNVCASEQ